MKHHFAQSATGYYIATRFSVRAGIAAIAGNLAHHAVEHYLKAALSPAVSAAGLKRISHNIPTLWKTFTAGDVALARFDVMIGEIDTFERLRYPDDLIVRGAMVAIGWKRSTDVPRPGSTMPMYRLAIEELDELVIAILDRASLNPRAFRPHTKEATDILLHDNAFADRWRVDE